MDIKKIQKLEREVKRMYCNPAKGVTDDSVRRQMFQDFWTHHIAPVVAESKKLAKKYGGDPEVAWIGALLHDISLLDDDKLHDEMSAKKAQQMLIDRGFDKKLAEKVSNVALTHRVKKYTPKTLEEKIVTTADAMNHFMPSFYLGIAVIASAEYSDLMKKNMEKLERDYENKIFFADEKKQVKQRLKDFKRWFGF
jgi:putative nucleotidyltransferase with HDIG domain